MRDGQAVTVKGNRWPVGVVLTCGKLSKSHRLHTAMTIGLDEETSARIHVDDNHTLHTLMSGQNNAVKDVLPKFGAAKLYHFKIGFFLASLCEIMFLKVVSYDWIFLLCVLKGVVDFRLFFRIHVANYQRGLNAKI